MRQVRHTTELDVMIVEILAENKTPGKPTKEVVWELSRRLRLDDHQEKLLTYVLAERIDNMLHRAAAWMSVTSHGYPEFLEAVRKMWREEEELVARHT